MSTQNVYHYIINNQSRKHKFSLTLRLTLE